MTIRIDDSFPLVGPAFGPTPSPTPAFDVGLISSAVTAPAPGTIACCIIPVVINYYTTFYHRKVVMAEDLISVKLYTKETIWIGRILFSNIIKVWNYILKILDNKRQAKVAKDLDYQFVCLLEKMEDGYQTFANLVKST